MRIKIFLIFILSTVFLLGIGGLVYLWFTQPAVVYQSWSDASTSLGETVGFGSISNANDGSEIVPVTTSFGLLIPKVNLNAPVLANVDGSNKEEYLWQVKQGIAHYKHLELPEVTVDGSLPGQGGNIFLFGHSQIPGGDTSNFQGVFNDLHKLMSGDRIVVFYQGERFEYEVGERKVVNKEALEYLERTPEETLTLMTCWPLGLDVKRYVVRARRV